MTDKQKLDALKMLLEGASYADVARKYTITRERVRQMFSGVVGRDMRRNKRVAYPALEEWFENSSMTYASMAEKVGCSSQHISLIMIGAGNPSKRVIDKILEVTGMTYEECFAKRKAPEEAATSIKG